MKTESCKTADQLPIPHRAIEILVTLPRESMLEESETFFLDDLQPILYSKLCRYFIDPCEVAVALVSAEIRRLLQGVFPQ
jgi:hypothetical protein